MCLRVDDALAVAVAFADVFFNVFDFRVFPYKKAVDTFVQGFLVPAVMDAAAGYDGHVTVIAHMEIVIDHFGQSALA